MRRLAAEGPEGIDAMIRDCTAADIEVVRSIINEAALAYRGVIPDDCWHEPYMTEADLRHEIAAGVRFRGWEDHGALVGVMGIQAVRDATLIRHAYVTPARQGQGIGRKLLRSLREEARGPVLIGTWAAATWAIGFYRSHGFRLVPEAEKDRLLEAYWSIPARQRESSVVLRGEGG
jgi:GNAT superfamily N-acetyltransferase